MMDESIKNYRTVDTLGKSRVELVIKVYDGAMANLKTAAEHYQKNERPQGYQTLEKAKKFLVHLYTTLDEEKGGEIARNLARLYTYLIEQINMVQSTGETDRLDDCILILNNIRAGWVELAEQAKTARPTTGAGDESAPQPSPGIKISV
jgi:flagellar protein FliS